MIYECLVSSLGNKNRTTLDIFHVKQPYEIEYRHVAPMWYFRVHGQGRCGKPLGQFDPSNTLPLSELLQNAIELFNDCEFIGWITDAPMFPPFHSAPVPPSYVQ